MPSSKGKRRSKSNSNSADPFPNSAVFSSSSSPFSNPDPNAEITQDELLCSLDQASQKFPSFISKAAFIGKVFNDSTSAPADPFFKGGLDSKGCKVWLSESAMVASSIAPGSIVSVSLASSRKYSNHYPLCSLADACAMNFGIELTEKLADTIGCYFALATVFPSSKLEKNAVHLSLNLSITMGWPAPGRIVYVNPVHLLNFSECDKSSCNNECFISLYKCKDLGLSLVSSKSKFTLSSMSSRIGLLPETTHVKDETSGSSSPKTPVLRQSKLKSTNSGQLRTPEDSRLHMSHLLEKSEYVLDVKDILGDHNVRLILQTCCTSWLFSRILLYGNFVAIPVLSNLCIFLVVGANSFTGADIRGLTKKSNCNMISQSENDVKLMKNAYLIDRGTKVNINLPSSPTLETSCWGTSSYFEPINGNSTAEVAYDLPKLGGLDQEFEVLKEIIISSAIRCDLARMGLQLRKGVLLHGPPGTGKTSLVRLCAHEAGVNLFRVNGPEIISEYDGESERALNEVFHSASKAVPAVVFIDELDAIAPARKYGGEELSHRMVATFLNLMDGIGRTDGLLVIAATNRLDSVDPALRRPGRLDREIEIGVPSSKQRLEILLKLLSDIKHSLLSLEIENIATTTHGFVGADLEALCNEAALVCLRRYIASSIACSASNYDPSNDLQDTSLCHVLNSCSDLSENIVKDLSSSLSDMHISTKNANDVDLGGTCVTGDPLLTVAFEDFENARVKVRPSAMREVVLEIPKVSWKDVGGQREVKMQLIEAVEWPRKHQEAFVCIGIQPPTGILMFGPPGCSKTLLARAVASEAKLNFLAVKGPELFSKWVGESEKAVRSLFAKARANAPSIIFFDEIDGLAVIRGKESDGVSVPDRVMSQLLVELDGLHQRVDVTVIAATNRPDKIDPALLRPGRFDRLLYVGPPGKEDREEIFRVHLHKMPCSSDVSFEELATLTEGYTGADISLICRQAAMAAMEENFDALAVTMKHLKAGVFQVQPSDVRSYEELSSKFQRHVRS